MEGVAKEKTFHGASMELFSSTAQYYSITVIVQLEDIAPYSGIAVFHAFRVTC